MLETKLRTPLHWEGAGFVQTLDWAPGECVLIDAPRKPSPTVDEWQRLMPELFQTWVNDLVRNWQDNSRVEVLSREILLLKRRLTQLEAQTSCIVPIMSLHPEPYKIIQTINAVVRLVDDEYTATFFDANISTTGDTDMEAIANLKDLIAGTFDMLSAHESDRLAPGPERQLSVLETYIKKVD